MSRQFIPAPPTGRLSVGLADSSTDSPDYRAPSTDTSGGSTNGPPPGFSGGGGAGSTSGEYRPPITIKRIGGKANVSAACGPCKRAHLACDVNRPCRRCANMGKDGMCEDVPHKKRGRPKVTKPLPGVPYTRNRPSPTSRAGSSRWRSPATSGNQHPHPRDSFGSSGPASRPRMLLNSSAPRTEYDGMYSAALPSPPLFTLFTTTDLRIVRCTPASFAMTGYPAHDYHGTHLADWVYPADRHLLELEHNRLMMNPMGSGPLHTDHDTQAAIPNRSERELQTPVDGMREPYPNQNVRILRADQQYSFCNVRLHLGGGLGGSLWHPHTHGKVYFVVSILLLPPPARSAGLAPLPGKFTPTTAVPEFVPSLSASATGSRRVSYDPPTPITPDQPRLHPAASSMPSAYSSLQPTSTHPGFEYEAVAPYPSSAVSAGVERSLPADLLNTPQQSSTFPQSFPRAVPAGFPTRSPSPMRHPQPQSFSNQSGMLHHQPTYTPDSYLYSASAPATAHDSAAGAGTGTGPAGMHDPTSASASHTPTYSPLPPGQIPNPTEYYPAPNERSFSTSVPPGYPINHGSSTIPPSSSPATAAASPSNGVHAGTSVGVTPTNGSSTLPFYQPHSADPAAAHVFDPGHAQQAQAVPDFADFGRRAWEL